jgi:microcin C transport system permease protein
MIRYSNETWDEGESFEDLNENGLYESNEPFMDRSHYHFPAVWDFLDFIPGIKYPLYESNKFNQDIIDVEVNFRELKKEFALQNNGNFIIMPFYPYHPHEDLKDELDEEYDDFNQNGTYDLGESFIDENGDDLWTSNNPPTLPSGFSGRHWIGTDNTGRDVFTRLIDGYRISITFAIIVTTLSYIIGVLIGGLLGYLGGKFDLFGVRLMEVFSAVPFLFTMMILGSFMQPSIILLATMAVFLRGWIGITYFIRGEFFREKARDYVSAAVSMGASNFSVMYKHILPNSLTPIITFVPFSIIGDIFLLVSLDFLGYGLKPPTSSWGNLLAQASENLDNWHMLIFPIIILTLTIFMITFISEAVREAFDPKVYSRLK